MFIKSLDRAEDYELCADIWLAASLEAHDFVSPSFWHGQRSAMAECYLPDTTIYLAVDDERVIGFASLDGSCLAALFVRPEDQGRGAARMLLDHLFDCYEELTLSVYLKNRKAITFYERRGFEAGQESLCPHTGETEIAMRRHKKTPV